MIDAELAILSIVGEGPIHGHTIQTVVTERGLRNWTNIGTSSLFYVLQKLEQQGLLASDAARRCDDDPASRQYRLTPAGYGVLQTAVADLLSTPRDQGNGFELGLANLHVLSPDQIRTAFAAYTQELHSQLHQLGVRRDRVADSPAQLNITAMFDRRIVLLQAELNWIADFIAAWETQAPPDATPPVPEAADIPRIKQVMLPHDPDSPHRAPTRRHTSDSPSLLSEAGTDAAITLPDSDEPTGENNTTDTSSD